MDHAEGREILELAAGEPGGLERLQAGDTPEAVAFASHLVECPICGAEWRRLSALNAALREAFAEGRGAGRQLAEDLEGQEAAVASAPPELKERTLRYVRELGRPVAAAEGAIPGEPAAVVAPRDTGPRPLEVRPASRRYSPGTFARRAGLARLAAAAAVIALIVGLGGAAYVRDRQLQDANAANSGLYELAEFQARVAAAGDARMVSLAAPDGTVRGSIVYSASTNEMAMSASGIPAPSNGQVLRCWVETSSGVRVLGVARSDPGGASWWGWPGSGLADVKSGDKFGVSLVDAAAATGSGAGTVVLVGTVGP